MGRGTYIGGHTVFGPGSDWFGYGGPPKRKSRKKGKGGPAATKPKRVSEREQRFENAEARRAAIIAEASERAAKRGASKAAPMIPGTLLESTRTFTVEYRKLKPRPGRGEARHKKGGRS